MNDNIAPPPFHPSSFGFEGSLINAKATVSGSGGAADCNGTGGDDAAARTFTPEQPINADAAEVDSKLGCH